MKTKFLRTSAFAALSCVALVATACSSAGGSSSGSGKGNIPAGPIKIGAIYSLSGNFAAFGPSQRATGQASIDQINADGGIAGHQLVLDVKDDKSTPDGAAC